MLSVTNWFLDQTVFWDAVPITLHLKAPGVHQAFLQCQENGTLHKLHPAYNLCVSGGSYPMHKRHKTLLKELKSTESNILPNEGYDLRVSHKIKLLGQDWYFLFNKVKIKQERLESTCRHTVKRCSFTRLLSVCTHKQCADLEPTRGVLITPDTSRTSESLWHK